MKGLKQYIIEALSDKEVSNLKVVYTTNPKDIVIMVPETYSEEDIMIWIDDTILNDMPSGEKYSKKLFGVNADNIVDTHTEFENMFVCSDQTKEAILTWDKEYDFKIKEDVNLVKYSLKNFQFIIEFDKFVVNGSGDTGDLLWKVFKNTQSSNINEYPVELHLDQNDISYDKN